MLSENQFQIRRASVEDAPMISQLGAQWFEETFRGTCTDDDMAQQLSEYYNEQQVARELADESDYFHLLHVDGQMLGYSRLKATSPAPAFTTARAIELKRLYFDLSAHGRGLAKQLMQYNIDLARSWGYSQIYLSVWEHNERAKAFYRKLGFVDTGVLNPFPIGQTPQTDLWLLRDL